MTNDSIEAKIGSIAPDFMLLATNGREISLKEFRGKSNVIVFFIRETTCPECRTHVMQLGRMYDQFREAGTEIIVVLGENVDKAREYVNANNLPFPILADSYRDVYKLYELEKYFMLYQRTASLVVDKDGVVRYLKRTTLPFVWLQESRELYGFVDSLNEDQNF